MSKTAVEQKVDDLKEIVVDSFERNGEQHKTLFEEQKKTNGSIINHEARICIIEKEKTDEKTASRWRYGLLMGVLCSGATILTTIILKLIWR